tara:strand:+ start:284 stop:997 length:714 start_codon:yes stop_codon:yes gene_type:complete
VIYFENVQHLEKQASTNSFEPIFQADDIVSILVSAPDMESARAFNISQNLSIATSNTLDPQATSSSSAATYLIDSEGNIEFPVLGTIKLGGLTRIEAKNLLREKLKAYILNPIINIRISNFKITVVGEVSSPGAYNIPNERVTVVEAIGLAGDMTIKGKRKDILVVRDDGDAKQFYKLDITSKDIFDSPAYYLAQNDVVYVVPNESRVKSSEDNNTFGVVLSAISVLLSITTLILRF